MIYSLQVNIEYMLEMFKIYISILVFMDIIFIFIKYQRYLK